MSERIIIADASCLISLSKINRLYLLRELFSNIVITPEIQREFKESLPEFIKILSVADRQKQLLLELEVDNGEASVIALALENENSLLIIDEKKGRKIARRLGINILGTLGILIKGKKSGILDVLKPEIEKLEKAGFRLSEELKVNILFAVDES